MMRSMILGQLGPRFAGGFGGYGGKPRQPTMPVQPVPAPAPHLTPTHLQPQAAPPPANVGEFMRKMQALRMAQGIRGRMQPRQF